MQSTFDDSSDSKNRYTLAVASRDSDLVATLKSLVAQLPIRVAATDSPESLPAADDRQIAAVVIDRRTMLGLGGPVIGRPMPAPPVLTIIDGSEGAALEALRRGTWDVIVPPFEARDLQRLLEPLLAEGVRRAEYRGMMTDFYERVNGLTSAESEVMTAVCDGKLNKQIARELNVSIRTVEQRRRRVFSKMNVPSAVPLACRVAEVRTLESLSQPVSFGKPPEDTLGPPATTGKGPNTPAPTPAFSTSGAAFGAETVNQPC